MLSLPVGGACADPRVLVGLAVRAEAAGWDGVLLEDYIVYGGDPAAPTCDPWAALAAAAVQTERIVLGTAVTPLARRRPWKVAREAATVDQLSGGRAVLGVGVGDVGDSVVTDASFTAFGEETTLRRRAERLDEALAVIAGLWTAEPFSFSGTHFTVSEVTFLPPPVQRPHIPIWVGGGYPTPGPTRRAARWDGSLLYRETHGGPWRDLAPDEIADIRRRAGERPYDVCVGGRARDADEDAERARIAAAAGAGATWWCVWVPPAAEETMGAAVDRGPIGP